MFPKKKKKNAWNILKIVVLHICIRAKEFIPLIMQDCDFTNLLGIFWIFFLRILASDDLKFSIENHDKYWTNKIMASRKKMLLHVLIKKNCEKCTYKG